MFQFIIKRGTPILFLILLFHSLSYSQRPNIIYIMTDDMGYGDLSGYGRKDYQTPNLDKLASQGIKFVNAYAAAPVCTPTRTGFMTGRYPAKTPVGLLEPLTPTKKDSAYGLSAAYPSVATLVKEKGYETLLIGKWHLGFLAKHSPLKNGFDYFFGIHTGAADYISHTGDEHVYDLFENDKPVYVDGYLTELFTQKDIHFLKQKHTKPFFLELAYNAPHWPWQGPGDKAYPDTASMKSGGSPAIYAAMMKSLDDGIGEIMKTLDDADLSKNTIVIFTNDNGGERYSDNGGLAKAKFTLWEGGIRVPAFVRWPGKIAAGSLTQQVIISMDWTATILAIAGAKARPKFPLDGIDLMPILMKKKKNVDRTLYWRVFQRNRQEAIRDGNWKYLKDENGEYLFNLLNDQQETKDLKLNEQVIFNLLKTKLALWEKGLLKPIPLLSTPKK